VILFLSQPSHKNIPFFGKKAKTSSFWQKKVVVSETRKKVNKV